MSDWDHTVDLLVVGSGAGAMSAGICGHDRGGNVLLIEKSGQYGGNSAMSGGGMWIPNNHLMPATGISDSREEALGYFKTVTGGAVSEERLETYIDAAPEMLRYMVEHTRLTMQSLPEYADYYPEVAGGKPGARSVEPTNFDAALLGDEFEKMREPAVQELIMGRMTMTVLQARELLCKRPGWVKLMMRLMGGYWMDLRWRMRTKRDRRLALGNALIGMLRLSMIDRNIPLWLDTAARELVEKDGRVVGVVAERGGKTIRIRATRGVVLAAGGFESNDAMRKKYLPNPTRAEWTCGSPSNTGDGIQMGKDLGAGLGFMDDAWWGPTSVVPGEARARMFVIEKALPGCMLVNKKGERFVNEGAPYTDVVKGMYERSTPEAPCVPAYLVFDANYRKKYPCGPFLQGSQQPDWRLPRIFREGYLKKADTLDALAVQLGIDAAGLKASAAKMTEYARTGKDLDFHKGESLFDRYYADETVQPNPCLAPINTAPYYALEAFPGDLGTKGGLETDARARVLKEDGSVIAGLYAVGNCSASVMGPTYPGAGATIGPAMTFGYIAARDAIAG